jgi:hypothetical protein
MFFACFFMIVYSLEFYFMVIIVQDAWDTYYKIVIEKHTRLALKTLPRIGENRK